VGLLDVWDTLLGGVIVVKYGCMEDETPLLLEVVVTCSCGFVIMDPGSAQPNIPI
jgi:hypothetical protein